MDMIKLYYRWSSGTTPDLEPDKLAQGVSSATNAMTQMTARTVTSEAQPATRPPLQPPGPCQSGHLITCCPSKQKPGADVGPTAHAELSALPS
jgi:hypothetical protein